VIEPFRDLLDVADAERLHIAGHTGRHDGVDPRGVARRGQQHAERNWGGMGNTESNGT